MKKLLLVLFFVCLQSCSFSTENEIKKILSHNDKNYTKKIKNTIEFQNANFIKSVEFDNAKISAQLLGSEGIIMQIIVENFLNIINSNFDDNKVKEDLKKAINTHSKIGEKTKQLGFYLGYGDECSGFYDVPDKNDEMNIFHETAKICIFSKKKIEGFPYPISIEQLRKLKKGELVKMSDKKPLSDIFLKLDSVDEVLKKWEIESKRAVKAVDNFEKSINYDDLVKLKFQNQDKTEEMENWKKDLKKQVQDSIKNSVVNDEVRSQWKNNLYGNICNNPSIAIDLAELMANNYIQTNKNFANKNSLFFRNKQNDYRGVKELDEIVAMVKDNLEAVLVNDSKYTIINENGKLEKYDKDNFKIQHLYGFFMSAKKYINEKNNVYSEYNVRAIKNICEKYASVDIWSNVHINKYLTMYNQADKNNNRYIFFNDNNLTENGCIATEFDDKGEMQNNTYDICNEYNMIIKNNERRNYKNMESVAKVKNKLANLQANSTQSNLDYQNTLQLKLISEKGNNENILINQGEDIKFSACLASLSSQNGASDVRLILKTKNIMLNDKKISVQEIDVNSSSSELDIKNGDKDLDTNIYFIDIHGQYNMKYEKGTNQKCPNVFSDRATTALTRYDFIIPKNIINISDINKNQGKANIDIMVLGESKQFHSNQVDNVGYINFVIQDPSISQKDIIIEKWVKKTDSVFKDSIDEEYKKTTRGIIKDEMEFLIKLQNTGTDDVNVNIRDSFYTINLDKSLIKENLPAECHLVNANDENDLFSVQCDNIVVSKEGKILSLKFKLETDKIYAKNSAIYSMANVSPITENDRKNDTNILNNVDFAHIFVNKQGEGDNYKESKIYVDTFLVKGENGSAGQDTDNHVTGTKGERLKTINKISGEKIDTVFNVQLRPVKEGKIDESYIQPEHIKIKTLFIFNGVKTDELKVIDGRDFLPKDEYNTGTERICKSRFVNENLLSFECEVEETKAKYNFSNISLSNNPQKNNGFSVELKDGIDNGSISIISFITDGDGVSYSAENNVGRGARILVGRNKNDGIVENTVRSTKGNITWDGKFDKRFYGEISVYSGANQHYIEEFRIRTREVGHNDNAIYNLDNYIMTNNKVVKSDQYPEECSDPVEYIKGGDKLSSVYKISCENFEFPRNIWGYGKKIAEEFGKDLFDYQNEKINNDEYIFKTENWNTISDSYNNVNFWSIINGDEIITNNISESKVNFKKNKYKILYSTPLSNEIAYSRIKEGYTNGMIILSNQGALLDYEITKMECSYDQDTNYQSCDNFTGEIGKEVYIKNTIKLLGTNNEIQTLKSFLIVS